MVCIWGLRLVDMHDTWRDVCVLVRVRVRVLVLQVSPDSGLLQCSTVADLVDFKFADEQVNPALLKDGVGSVETGRVEAASVDTASALERQHVCSEVCWVLNFQQLPLAQQTYCACHCPLTEAWGPAVAH